VTERNISSAHPEVLEGRAEHGVAETNVVARSWFENITMSGNGDFIKRVAV
jgi:hypothetical protein